MNARTTRTLNMAYLNHRLVAAMTLVCVALSLAHEHVILSATWVAFALLFLAQRLHTLGTYNGYGVARVVNGNLHANLIPVHTLVFGMIPGELLRSWIRFGGANVLATIALAILFVAKSNEHFVTFAAMCAGTLWTILIAEIYVWLIIDRKRQWYLAEERLSAILHARHTSIARTRQTIRRFRKQQLLSYGFKQF